MNKQITIGIIKLLAILNLAGSGIGVAIFTLVFFGSLGSTDFNLKFAAFMLGFDLLCIFMVIVNIGILRWREWARKALIGLHIVLFLVSLEFDLSEGITLIDALRQDWKGYLYLIVVIFLFNLKDVKQIFAEKAEGKK
jgi:hypothetical protein